MIADDLAGKRIAITGSTGFLGTALVERLLRSVPDCELVLLIRAGRMEEALIRLTMALDIRPDAARSLIVVTATVRTSGRTGVEMEALTAVSVACLTIYDMLKAVDKAMTFQNIRLVEKQGGRSGHWLAAEGSATPTPAKKAKS